METFERKLTTTGDAVGLTIPKYLVDNLGYRKGRRVKVILQILDESPLNNLDAVIGISPLVGVAFA
jgi:hypothetical protein